MNLLQLDQKLYEHSLNVILDYQAQSGAFLACPNMPDYQFSWFRDGAFIAHALTLDGETVSRHYKGSMSAQWENAYRFHDWCARMVNRRESNLQRAIEAVVRGEQPDKHDLLNSRYRVDGEIGPDEWPEFQLDGPGTWLWSLHEYIQRIGFSPLPVAWENAIIVTANYLAAMWKTPCYDCWEERGTDIHISTLGAIFAGLQAAEKLVPALDFSADCAAIKAFVLENGLTPNGELAKSVGLDMVDANLISVAVPYGMFAPDDPIMVKTVARIERELHAPNSGVHRHVEDTYYGGGVWVLLAAWLAWYYLEVGEQGKAAELMSWVQAQADADGNLPEQTTEFTFDANYYEPWVKERGEIAKPLLWSHAKYVILCRLLAAQG